MSSRRPAVVSWLSLGVLSLGAIYLIRMAGGLMAPDLPLSVPRGYLPVTGAVWGLGWVTAAAALFTGRRWAPRMLAVLGTAFLMWYWADRMLFVRSEHALRTLPFSLALTAVGTALVLLALRQPSVRRYFGESKP
ncbi:MAG: hypothetical protein MUO35_03955 [Anaerolineales bacterium]|nr:hypothetical protein [Anaerolineales bacterium]